MLMLANRAIAEDVAAARVAEHQRVRHLEPAGRSMPGGGSRARARSASGARSCLRGRPRSSRGAWCASRAARRRCRRCSGFSSAASSNSTSASRACRSPRAGAPREVILRGAELRALEREPRVAVVGLGRAAPSCIRRPRGRSPDVARPFAPRWSAPVAAQPPANRQSDRHTAEAGGEKFRSGRDALTTSTPRGILNTKSLSANPTFSFRFVNEKLELPPCASVVTSPRIRASPGRPPASANRSPAGGFGHELQGLEPAAIPAGIRPATR